MSDYLAYQEKYRDTPRDSDRELIRLIRARVPQGGRVLDVGCSTGNLLRHLHAARPDLELWGCDIDEEAVYVTRHVEGVQGVAHSDVALGGSWGKGLPNDSLLYDAGILNAVLYCLDDDQTLAALRNIYRILKPGGHLFIWDLLHRWEQRLTITEESERYGKPTIHIRPWSLLHNMAADTGFSMCEILPQHQPYLPKPTDPADLTSWTYPVSCRGGGISFRGGLAQPWCHAILTR